MFSKILTWFDAIDAMPAYRQSAVLMTARFDAIDAKLAELQAQYDWLVRQHMAQMKSLSEIREAVAPNRTIIGSPLNPPASFEEAHANRESGI